MRSVNLWKRGWFGAVCLVQRLQPSRCRHVCFFSFVRTDAVRCCSCDRRTYVFFCLFVCRFKLLFDSFGARTRMNRPALFAELVRHRVLGWHYLGFALCTLYKVATRSCVWQVLANVHIFFVGNQGASGTNFHAWHVEGISSRYVWKRFSSLLNGCDFAVPPRVFFRDSVARCRPS